MGDHGKWREVLLLFDVDDHLLQVVGCDMSFPPSTPAAHGVLSVDMRMGDIDGC